MPSTNTAKIISSLIIFSIWLIARIYVYCANWPYFPLAHTDDSTFNMWYLPPEIVQHHFAESMLYLRGEPPLPQLFLGTLMKLAGWPFSWPLDSILLSLATLITAFLMQDIMLRFAFNRALATGLAAAWCIYPACLGVEVAAFPTAFYEALPAFFFTLALWLCLRCFDKEHNRRWLWAFGLAGVMLSMSRSTLSWIFLLPIFIVLFIPGDKKKLAIGCLALAVQLLWAAKNYAVYGQFNLETASDVGQNILSTVMNTGHFDEFHAFSVSRHPDDAFILEGLPCLAQMNIPCAEKLMPTVEGRDTLLQQQLSTNSFLFGESYFMHEMSKQIKPLFSDFLLHNPSVALDMIARSYQLFWGNIYWQVSYIPGLDADPLLLRTNALTEKYKWFNIVAIHLLSPIAVCLIFISLLRRQRLNPLQVGFLYALLAFCYVALVSSLGDHGENARYRVDVEPLVWLLPFISFRCITHWRSLSTENHNA